MTARLDAQMAFLMEADRLKAITRATRNHDGRFENSAEHSWHVMLHALVDECRRLDAEPAIETTLMILPDGMSDFEDYLDLLNVAEALLEAEGYAGIYQLASFHPEYVFAGAPAEDPANYTNRSPWPMWHLLRETSVEAAVAAYPDPESIPERNVDALREAGHAVLAEEWAACRAVRADE